MAFSFPNTSDIIKKLIENWVSYKLQVKIHVHIGNISKVSASYNIIFLSFDCINFRQLMFQHIFNKT